MLALQIESKTLWYEPEAKIIPIEDYSMFKKELICSRFETTSIEELTVGSYVETDDYRITIVEIDD